MLLTDTIVLFSLFLISSGVATLSCTDSSATSSEDASNPGSPYSPPSNDDLLNLIVNFKRQKSQQPPSHQRSNRPAASGFVVSTTVNPDVESSTFLNPPSKAPVSSISTISNTNMLSTAAAPLLSLLTSINTIKPKRIRGSSVGTESNAIATKRNRTDNNNSSTSLAKIVPKNLACDGNCHTATDTSITIAATTNSSNGADKMGATSDAKIAIVGGGDGDGIPIAPKVVASNATTLQHIFSPPNLGSQTKITGFFKSQLKTLPASGLKKDLNNVMHNGNGVATTTAMVNNGNCTTAQIGGGIGDNGLKAMCSMAAISATSRTKTDAIQTNCNNLSVRALTSITHSSNATALKKLERKTAKVAPLTPIARKSNIAATKKTYPTVLPKKHVYIAPRTSNVIDVISKSSSTTPNMLAASVKRAELMHHQHHHSHIHPHHHQPHQPHDHKASILQSKLPPSNGVKSSVTTPSASKLNGSVYQLHPAPAMPKLVQIPTNLVGSTAAAATTTKEANAPNAPATSNLVINNGTTHYFLNGTVIKLQQMSTPQQVRTKKYIYMYNIRTDGRTDISFLYIYIKL